MLLFCSFLRKVFFSNHSENKISFHHWPGFGQASHGEDTHPFFQLLYCPFTMVNTNLSKKLITCVYSFDNEKMM